MQPGLLTAVWDTQKASVDYRQYEAKCPLCENLELDTCHEN